MLLASLGKAPSSEAKEGGDNQKNARGRVLANVRSAEESTQGGGGKESLKKRLERNPSKSKKGGRYKGLERRSTGRAARKKGKKRNGGYVYGSNSTRFLPLWVAVLATPSGPEKGGGL